MAEGEGDAPATAQLNAIQESMGSRQGFRMQALIQYLLARGAVELAEVKAWYVDLLGHDGVEARAAAEAFDADRDNVNSVLKLTADLELHVVKQDGAEVLTIRRLDPAESDAFDTAARHSIGPRKTEKVVSIFIQLMKVLGKRPGERMDKKTAHGYVKANVTGLSDDEIGAEIQRLIDAAWLAVPSDELTTLMLGPRGEAERQLLLNADSDSDDEE
eukprot:INCI12166.2.p1 GENE.INCI12166.2~~INCI12166.2.p1  ORF type:complete len:216 (+),score=45.74 INCI12166.2:338-985(+)